MDKNDSKSKDKGDDFMTTIAVPRNRKIVIDKSKLSKFIKESKEDKSVDFLLKRSEKFRRKVKRKDK